MVIRYTFTESFPRKWEKEIRSHSRFWMPRITPGLVRVRYGVIEGNGSEEGAHFASCGAYSGGTAADIGFSEYWFNADDYRREVVFVHELLHVTHYPLAVLPDLLAGDAEGREKGIMEKVTREAVEIPVEVLSHALVDLRYAGS